MLKQLNIFSPPPEGESKKFLCLHFTYPRCRAYLSLIQFIASVLLLVEVIFRFVFFLQLGTLPNYILTFYYLVFSVYMMGFELGIKRLKLKFYLMNFAWGKALMNFFLASLIVSSWVVPVIDVLIVIVFSVAVTLQVITSCLYKTEETASIDADIEELENYRE